MMHHDASLLPWVAFTRGLAALMTRLVTITWGSMPFARVHLGIYKIRLR